MLPICKLPQAIAPKAQVLIRYKQKGPSFKDPFYMVRERGLEPPHLAAPAPQTGVSTISPLAHISITILTDLVTFRDPEITSYKTSFEE